MIVCASSQRLAMAVWHARGSFGNLCTPPLKPYSRAHSVQTASEPANMS